MIHPDEEPAIPHELFSADRLKALPGDQLVEALIADAHESAALLSGTDRLHLEDELMAICWVPSEEDEADHQERSDELDQILGRLAGAIVAFPHGEDLDPEEARQRLAQNAAGRALAEIDRSKEELELGLQRGRDDDGVSWNQGSTKYNLLQILEAQAEAGISYASDYVRETAIRELDHPGLRGVVLLHNVHGGDQASYALGIEAMQEAVREGNLGWDDASQGFDVTMRLLQGAEPDQRPILRDLTIDMICRLREWRGIASIPSYTTGYATTVASAAVAFRQS